MAVTLYKSTDGSAPVLTGQVGALITVLDAVLVNGYGAKAAAGWTKAFSGTNTAAYRMGTTGNTGFYLDVLDNAGATAKEARVRGYETMSAVSTGTGPFPTTAQSTNGIFLRKSTTADATARAWTIVADSSVFYLFTETGDQANPTWALTFMFGDFFSYKASDAYRCAIIGRTTENSATLTNENFPTLFAAGFVSTATGHYVSRSYTGLGSAIQFAKHHDAGTGGSGDSANTTRWLGVAYTNGNLSTPNVVYPNPPDNGLYMSPVWLHHTNAMRGYLKGVWAPLHDRPLGHNDTFTGTGNLSGKTFLVQNVPMAGVTSYPAQVFIETSDTWS